MTMQKEPLKIHFILTGGTIDSYFDGIKDTALPNEKSVIPKFIQSLNLYQITEFSEICMKDSRNLTADDVKNVLDAIEKSADTKIIVTHGTYTMPDTARYLKANLKRKDQTILLTGSMIPISGFSPSDGPFSLGYAIAQVEYLPAGVYVCMNGKVFESEEVTKIIAEGRFTSIFKS